MAKAASMTQASMDDGNQTPRNSHGSIAAGRAGGGGGGLGGGKTELHNRNDPPSSKSAPSFASPSGVFGRKGGNDNTMEEGQGEAGVEFERLAQSLKESAAVVAGGVVNLDGAKGRSSDVAVGAGGTEKGGRTLKGQRPSPPTTMDVDSDEEEETVTLRGEFQSASASAAAGGSRNVGVGGGEATASTAHIEAAVLPVKGECGVVANDDEEDLVSAVKKGKGRKGKGSEKGRKLGKRKT